MANYSNDFQAIGAASGMPAGFTNRWLSTATFSTTDAGSGNIALTVAVSTINVIGISMDAVDADADRQDGEVLVKLRATDLPSSTTVCGALARGSGASGAENAYFATLYGGFLQIAKLVGGAYTLISSDGVIINDSGETSAFANVFYWLRFRYVGTALKARIWRHNMTEPGAWDIETTDSSVTGDGYTGMLVFNAATHDFSDIAVATNSDTASMAAGAPVLTAPTGAATGNTTANAGATIDAVSGSGSRIMYALARIGGSPASSATIIATGTQLAVTSAGAKSVPLTGLTPGASYSADVVYVDATTGTSNVVTGTWTQPTAPVLSSPTNTPGSTTALIGATTTVSSGTAYFLARVGGSAASAAAIIATGQTSTVSTTTPSRTVTGLTASTANNFVDIVQVSGVTTSNVVSAGAFTTAASGDTTVPALTGSIVIGAVTSSSIQFSWPAGSDNVAVTSYEVSSNGGSGYVDAGNVLTYTFTGLTASTSYALRVRAKDAAGNVSTPALAATQSTAAASGVGSISLNNAALYTFRKNNGAIIVSTSVTFFVNDVSTGALIGSAITGLSSNALGLVTTAISNASMLAGTTYRLSYEFSSGEYGSAKLPAV